MKIKILIISTLFISIKIVGMDYPLYPDPEKTIAASFSRHLNYPQCLIDLVVWLTPLGPNCVQACEKLITANPNHMEARMQIVSGTFTQEEKQAMQAKLCTLKCQRCLQDLRHLLENFSTGLRSKDS